MPYPPTERLLKFLNDLPTTSDFSEWCDRFNAGLQELLGDVDRVSIGIEFPGQIEEFADEVDHEVHIRIMEFSNQDAGNERQDVTVETESSHNAITPAELFVESARRLGYPVDRHQPPIGYDYYSEERNHLGSIILWRDHGNPPISKATQQFMVALEPFLCYVLSDYLARVQSDNPMPVAFRRAMYKMCLETGLTMQEQKIMWLRMFGHSYKGIADVLAVSVGTVKKHLNTIHHKTETRSLAEIFGKYFASYLDIPSTSEASRT